VICVGILLLVLATSAQAFAQDEWDVEVEEEPAAATPTPASGDWDVDVAESTAQPVADQDFATSSLFGSYLTPKGYFENQAMAFTLPRQVSAPDASGWELMNYNRLRIDLGAKPVRGFSMDADLVVRTYHGTTTYDLRDMLPKKFDRTLAGMAAVDPSLITYQMTDEIFLDNAFFTANAGPLRLKVGKQQIRFGSGYLWNPTDPFNVKDLLDPTYELTGITAARLQLFLPHEVLLEAYALPYKRLGGYHMESAAGAARARIALGQWVVAATYAYFWDVVGVDWSLFPVDARRNLVGLEVTGEVAGVGVWGEGAFNIVDQRDTERFAPFGHPDLDLDRIAWVEALGGVNYMFEGGVLVQAEYLYNGRGRRHSENYVLWDWMAYLEQTVRYLGRHYATGLVQVPLESTHVTLSLMGITNLSDESFVLTPWIQWDWSQYLAVMLYGGISWGDQDTDEFRAMGQAAYLRFRFSF